MKRTTSDVVRVMSYRPDVHSAGAFSLWERTLGDRWPISPKVFREITEAVFSRVQTYNVVATDTAGSVLGYLASQVRPRKDTEASVILLTVDPSFQRQGIGTKLLNTTLETFKADKIVTVHAGANAELPFWQGIPACLPYAKHFFEKHGWEIYEKSYDLVMDLSGFKASKWVADRPKQHGVCIRGAQQHDIPALKLYVGSESPDWRWFVAELEQRGPGGIVVAVRGEQVLGSVITKDLRATDWTGWQWRAMLGKETGALGAVSVAEPERNKGIGLAMVAEASRMLRDRGVRNCFVGWTWLVDWYGRLGYKVWQEYWMARKSLCNA